MNSYLRFPPLAILPAIFIFATITSCQDKKDWQLVWSEEFEYEGNPPASDWGYEIGYIRNNELQYYTDEIKNVEVNNGRCIIRGLLEENDSITSGSINTFGKRDFLYGRIEVKAKIPSALGSWPAIWMLGTNIGDLGWPACGEIDIMEHVGFDPEKIHANIHTKAYNHVMRTSKGNTIEVTRPWNDFHIYALEWYEDRLDFFYDDSLYFSFLNDGTGNHDTWPFDKPHYLLINLAYGGSWGGREGVNTSLLPLEYLIDYVKYYQLK